LVPIYNAFVLELERRRLARGISMDAICELMGVADRSYAKMLYPEKLSGRLAGWERIQQCIEVLFCEGFELRIVPKEGEMLTAVGTRRKIKQEAATWSRPIRREVMRELAQQAVEGRMKKLTPAQRKAIAKKAARARWKKVRLAQKSAATDAGQSAGL
jgi:hypothetical protein